ncbi:hypothetical protein NYQ10_07085 [Flavobacterium johnsoniae]|uniref:hypothetical protein n=1 Tax=Flavobacterium johnsoniae TaxID=986 RepID=UPI0025B00A34|nr:hypothetical protein [Flavobacterium johnsoniae]WJS96216.1 hypothetical protein NYQ10_07085 [Flavobacterium johnsoniae]
MELKDILTITGLSVTLAGIINGILYQYIFLPKVNRTFKKFEFELKQKDLINQEQWKHKRDACFNALNIADALISNYKYPNEKEGDIKPGKVTTEEVRKCFNDLACSCNDTKVIDLLKKIISESVRPDIIVDLRNAVRVELEFGNKEFDKDRDKAFVGKIDADKE